jgi:hypothetical protein
MDILLNTIFGSHLYGLSHADSDIDYYTVTTTPYSKGVQTIAGEHDDFVVPFARFVTMINAAIPQSLEALYSPLADPSPLDGYRFGYRVDTTQAVAKFGGAMTQLFMEGTFKKRRHGYRLLLHLNDILTYGHFNPVLTDSRKELLGTLSMEKDIHACISRFSTIGIDNFALASKDLPFIEV